MDAALAAVVAASETVDGVESYSYHRGDDGTYWFFAIMSNLEAMRGHGDTEAMKAAMGPMMALLDGRPDMSITTPIAANGLDI